MRARASDKDSQQGHVLGGQRTRAPRMDREKTGRKERYPRWQGYSHCPPTSASEGGTCPGSVNTPWPPCMCVSGQQRNDPVSRAHSVLSMCYTSSLKPILGDPTPQAYNQSWGTPHPSTTNAGAPLTLHLQPILGTPHHTFTTNPGGNKTPAYNQPWGALSTPSPGEYAGAPGSYVPLRVKYADTGWGVGELRTPPGCNP